MNETKTPTLNPSTEQEEMTFYQLLEQFTNSLERVTRRDENDQIVRIRDNAPGWVTDVTHEAHGDHMPDDHIFRFIEKIADQLIESLHDDGPDASPDSAREALYEVEPDIYTADLLKWLSSNLGNVDYLGEAVQEYGDFDGGGFRILAAAQQRHIMEVGDLLINALEERADDPELLGPDEDEDEA